MTTNVMTPERFRTIALAQPNAVESAHMNHPDFRIGNRIFASLGYPETGWAMVRLTAEQQAAQVSLGGGVFAPANGAWGRQGCTLVRLDAAQESTVSAALALAAGNLRAAGTSTLKPKGVTRASARRRTGAKAPLKDGTGDRRPKRR